MFKFPGADGTHARLRAVPPGPPVALGEEPQLRWTGHRQCGGSQGCSFPTYTAMGNRLTVRKCDWDFTDFLGWRRHMSFEKALV